MDESMKLNQQDYELCQKLKAMRLSGMAEELEQQLSNPNTDLLSFSERIEKVVSAEWDLRFNKKFNRFLKKASLKYPAADFDRTLYDPARQIDTNTVEHLAQCTWIITSRNYPIPGLTQIEN